MTLLVKIDEDLPAAIVQLVQDAGYDAVDVLQQGMSGWKDPPLWEAIQKEGRFLITADKGFGDIRVYPPGSHAGVLVLRPSEDGIRPVVGLTQQVLSRYRLENLEGSTVVATPRGIRMRRAPRKKRDRD